MQIKSFNIWQTNGQIQIMSIPRDRFGVPYDHQIPLAVDPVDQSSRVTVVTAETVSFIVASTNVADAGSAAGTIIYGRLTNGGIIDSMRMAIGTNKDTSLTFTSSDFTTEKAFPYEAWNHASETTRTQKLDTVVAATLTTNGDYAVDYRTGLIVGKKAATGTSLSANYAYRSTSSTIISGGGGDASAANQTSEIALLTTANTNTGSIATSTSSSATSLDVIEANTTGLAQTVKIDDSVFSVASDRVLAIGLLADETSADSVDEGDIGIPRMTITRFAKVSQGDLLSGEDQTNNLIAVVEKPLAVSTYTPDLDTSTALEASSVTKASAGVLYGFSASNTNAAGHWIQFFNSTTVPADTAVPVLEFAIGGEGTVSAEWPKGRFFSTGIAWCISSTNGAKTIAGATALADVNYK